MCTAPKNASEPICDRQRRLPELPYLGKSRRAYTSVTEHTHHPADSPASQYVACHMPRSSRHWATTSSAAIPSASLLTVVGTFRYFESLRYLSQGQIDDGRHRSSRLGDYFAVTLRPRRRVIEIAPVGTDAAVRHHRHLSSITFSISWRTSVCTCSTSSGGTSNSSSS